MPDTTFYATSYSPPRNGVSDDVPAVQSAVNAAAAAGGGKVVLAEGDWTFKSQLVLKNGVTLEGMGRSFDQNTKALKGTVINVKWGSGSGSMDNPARAAITMETATTIRSMAFNYPDQLENDFTPAEYGPTIKLYENYVGGGRPYNAQNIIEDLFFFKSYVAIDARGTSARPGGSALITTARIDNIVMSALRVGIRLDNVSDWVFVNRVEQQPGYIGVFGPGTSLRDYVQKNCRFIELAGRTDWLIFTNVSAWACLIGFELNSANGPFTITASDLDACRTSIQVNGTSSMLNIKLTACTFTCFDAIQKVAGFGNWSGYVVAGGPNCQIKSLSFSNCYLFGPSRGWGWFGNAGTDVSTIQMMGCQTDTSQAVGGNQPAYITASAVDHLIAVGNVFDGNATTLNSGSVSISQNNNLFI